MTVKQHKCKRGSRFIHSMLISGHWMTYVYIYVYIPCFVKREQVGEVNLLTGTFHSQGRIE